MLNMVKSKSESTNVTADRDILEWVAAAKAGDDASFRCLYDRFYAPIFRMIYYRTRSRSDSEDLTQDVFMAAYKRLAGLKQPHLFRAWLFRIAVNRVRDFFRRKRLQKMFFRPLADYDETQPVIPDDADGPLTQVVYQEFWRHIALFLKGLPQMEHEVFVLRFLDQLSFKEIAHVLKRSESTVKTHLYRSTLKFKQSPIFGAYFKEMESESESRKPLK